MKSALVIGISGATCSGKTTLALELQKLFPKSRIFHQDDYFLEVDDPRHVWCKDVDHINYDILTSLDMDKMFQDIMTVVESRQLCKKRTKFDAQVILKSDICRSSLSAIINKTINENDIELVFLDGFLLYGYKPLLPIITLKYFHILTREECVRRRERRVYDPPDIPGYFDKCVWPEYLKHLEDIKSNVEDITYIDSGIQNVIDVVLNDIYNCLKEE
ncbi:nicotinamide riboside kinase 1 [Coccinella septempunctata]|uniref:nicotinamide riboside kinase 1 n=1 Tax=Coccinella septempunctata TaxID=41139 RepID=UPI001D06E2E3|nr:nicotinamide riboside kinase 1 [Coccinella septempunctata]